MIITNKKMRTKKNCESAIINSWKMAKKLSHADKTGMFEVSFFSSIKLARFGALSASKII